MKTAYKQTATLQKLSDSRATDMDRLKKLAGIPSSKQESQDNKELEKLKKELFQYAKDDPMVASVLTAKNKDEFDRRLKALYSIRAGADVIDLIRRMQELAQGKISNKRSESRSTPVTEDVNSRLKKFAEEAQKVLARKLPKELKGTFTSHNYSGKPDRQGTVYITPGKVTLSDDVLICGFNRRFEPKDVTSGYSGAEGKFKQAVFDSLKGLAKQHNIQMYERRHDESRIEIQLIPLMTKPSDLFNEDEIEKQAALVAKEMSKKSYEFMYSYGEHIGGNGWDEPREYDENYSDLSAKVSVDKVTLNKDGEYELSFDLKFDGIVTDSEVEDNRQHEAMDEFYSDFLWKLRNNLPGLHVELVDDEEPGQYGLASCVFALTMAH